MWEKALIFQYHVVLHMTSKEYSISGERHCSASDNFRGLKNSHDIVCDLGPHAASHEENWGWIQVRESYFPFNMYCDCLSFKYCTFFQASDMYPRVNCIKDGCSFRNLLNRHPTHIPPTAKKDFNASEVIAGNFTVSLAKNSIITTWTEMSFLGRIKEVRLFRSHLWPNLWSHRVPIGAKWKIYGHDLSIDTPEFTVGQME